MKSSDNRTLGVIVGLPIVSVILLHVSGNSKIINHQTIVVMSLCLCATLLYKL